MISWVFMTVNGLDTKREKKKCQVTLFVYCSLKGNGNEERYYDNHHEFFHCFVTYGQTHPYHPYHNNHQQNDYHRLNYGLLNMYTISGLRSLTTG